VTQPTHACAEGSAVPSCGPGSGDGARLQPPRNRASGLSGLIACVAALAVAGTVLAARLVGRGAETHNHAHPAPARTDDVGRDIPTSFGVVAAETVRTLGGLGARPLAGVTHGIQNLVGPRQMQVQVLVALTNELSRPVAYAPQQFSLRVGARSRRLRATAATFHPGTLQPQASIEGTLAFVAARADGPLVLEFDDRRGPIALDLGRAAPGRAPPAYPHHH
jgi:hypothetical protein